MDYIIKAGKYAGVEISLVPGDDLRWLSMQAGLIGERRQFVDEIFRRRAVAYQRSRQRAKRRGFVSVSSRKTRAY